MNKGEAILSKNQVFFYTTLLEESEQEKLLQEINNLKKLLAAKEQLYKDNELTLSQVRLENSNMADRFFNIMSNYDEDILRHVGPRKYNKEMSAWRKVSFVLIRGNKAMSSREIIDTIYQFEPELRDVSKEKKKKIEDNIFAILSKAAKKGTLIRFKHKTEYMYGFNDWFYDGQIKPEYLV